MRARTNSDVHAFSRNFRAVARSISWSALNPKSIEALLGGGPEMAPTPPNAWHAPAKPWRASVTRVSLTLRQPEHPLADDVLLDLGRAALDRVGARPEEGILPHAVVDGDVGAPSQQGVRPLDLHGQLLQALVRLDPAHLARGGLGSRQLAAQQLRDRARARIFQGLGVDPERRELLPHDRVLGGRAAVLLHPLGHVDERLQRDAQPYLETEAEGEPLVHERGEAHRPAVVDAAQDVALVNADVVEEDLVELGVAGDLLERLDRHAG